VIYPLAEDADRPRTQDFLARANAILKQNPQQQPPFPFLVDVGLKLVDSLGIRKNLSKPATYILDPTGAVRFSYVGETLADRPSIKALLEQLATLKPPSGEG
jgi:peroxiredoxin